MNPTLRLVFCAVYFYSLVTALNHYHPGWFGELAEANRLPDELRRWRDLRAQSDAIRAYEEAQQVLIADLTAGRLTVRQAGTRLGELERTVPGHSELQLRRCFVGRCDEERYCRKVVAAARLELGESLGRLPHVIARLEAELDQLLDSDEIGAAE